MFVLLLIVVALVLLIYYYVIKPLTYWKEHNVSQASISYTLKHTYRMFSKQISIVDANVKTYNLFPNDRYMGVYQLTKPVLMLREPDLIKEITVKSFDHFMDHTVVISENVDPLMTRNLVSLKGQKWKDMRSILSPSFTSSKMKIMFNLMSECAENFSTFFAKKEDVLTEVELKEIFTRFTTDVIATTAFGVKVDSLKEQNNEFYRTGTSFMKFSGAKQMFKFFFITLFPKVSAALKLRILDKRTNDFFYNLIESTIKTREEKGIIRPDMIYLLMEARKGNQIKEENHSVNEGFSMTTETHFDSEKEALKAPMTNMDIIAQAVIFFLAGFETVSTAMCFLGYELAVNQDCQKRLREEINETFEDCEGKLTYEAILKMKYLDMCLSEALRKWPPAFMSERQCTKSFTIDPQSPGEAPLKINKGLTVWMPIFAMQRDPKYYSDPEKFDPERFSEENRNNINPYAYFPFGLGPRNCIGSRFALLEVKVLFFYLLKQFELVPVARSQIPLKLSRKRFNMTAENGFWFGLKRI